MGYANPEDFYEAPQCKAEADRLLSLWRGQLTNFTEPHRYGWLGEANLEWWRGTQTLTITIEESGQREASLLVGEVGPEGTRIYVVFEGGFTDDSFALLWDRFSGAPDRIRTCE